jgi:hypothetical protein
MAHKGKSLHYSFFYFVPLDVNLWHCQESLLIDTPPLSPIE